MGEEQSSRKRSVLVPFDIGPSVRAPFGWTNKMRREEGWPLRGQTRPAHAGFWPNLALGTFLYGPYLAGATIGGLTGGFPGVMIGLAGGLIVQLAGLMVAAMGAALMRRHS